MQPTPRRVSERLSYPFAHFQLSDEQARVVNDRLVALDGRFGLYAARPALLRLVHVFIQQCCPEEPTERALALLSHFLYMTLHFNERRSEPGLTPLLTQYFAVLRGRDVAGDDAVLRAARAFRTELAALLSDQPSDPAPFFHYLSLNLSAFCSDSEGRTDAKLASYLGVRVHSISALGYFQFWKLLLAVDADSEMRFGTLLFQAEMASAAVQALANDLCCVERDRRDGNQNTVSLAQAEFRLSEVAATDLVQAWHQRAVDELDRIALPAGAPMEAERYLRFIKSCAWGNLRAMQVLSARYG